MPPNRKAAIVALAACALGGAAAGPADAGTQAGLGSALARQMRAAGGYASAYVVNLSEGRRVFSWKSGYRRILASNTKLFTTSAALARYGTEGTLGTEVLGRGRLGEDGIWRGDLYLRGGGDPTFGTRRFTRRSYGRGATVEALAKALTAAGIERVTGRVYGDESRFDSLRGGPDSRYGVSIWVGPLSALSFNRGLADEGGAAFQANPPSFAAARLDDALEARGVVVKRTPRTGRAPRGLDVLASVESPPMERLVKLTNKPSDNFFAETLVKDLALQARGRGTTAGGARLAARYARRLGARARLVDGSGLSRGNRASPAAIVKLLGAVMRTEGYDAFVESLPIAGRDGTLYDRMRRGPARGNCHAKTGTLSDVSALSGYCEARSGDTYAFSILMNAFPPTTARGIQDRMVQAIAGVSG
ncbi:MAG: D-alanyl-D-alanine carboxypeptidase/D-alanyl-D-alanine-endopeptidase [Thermoleophilaceae bacterium]|nr:D-alanyl-D-alanine carboxypeptidase/D-alanyl-D-alanine-endopeptidase [Thermoleophilaceae bacterium]